MNLLLRFLFLGLAGCSNALPALALPFLLRQTAEVSPYATRFIEPRLPPLGARLVVYALAEFVYSQRVHKRSVGL
jgi:hypothetical protein